MANTWKTSQILSRMNILVTGANGQLGSELKYLTKQGHQQNHYTFTDVDELDLTEEGAIDDYLSRSSFDFIINCAAYTAVDKAEEDREMAHMVNALVPEILAKKADENGIRFIHISTDFVFSGENPRLLREADETRPISVYGETKLEGEEKVRAATAQYFIIRTSWLYSSFGKNFVKTILRLADEKEQLTIIADQIGTPTYARDLAKVILKIIDTDSTAYGLYHYSNEGVASWYDFAYQIASLSQANCKIRPIPTEQYPTPAKRPKFSVMDKSLIKHTFELDIPHWNQSLENCLTVLQNSE